MLCLSHDLKRNQFLANCDIIQMIQDCCNEASSADEDVIKCYSFYTDGGAYSDSNTYFLYRLQGDGNTLYSTIKIPDPSKKGVNI